MIKLDHVNKYFGDLHVLKDVSLEVKEGEKLVIIGPSGSGKSTTVRCMNFLEEPTSGHVYIDGRELTHKNKTHLVRETTSMVFQQFNLYPHMTVLKNLTLAPIKLHHKSKAEAEQTAFHYLEVVGLVDKAHAYPTTLSGGQQQRIAIARALCAQTKIILFDEPTSALDPETIQEVLDVMIRLGRGRPCGVHGRRPDHRVRDAGTLLHQPPERAGQAVPGQNHTLKQFFEQKALPAPALRYTP